MRVSDIGMSGREVQRKGRLHTIYSMTGYGRKRALAEGYDISFEVKAVNSRYLDLNIKTGRLYTPLEERIKKLVCGRVSRGKVDVYLSVGKPEGGSTELSLNRDYLEAYLRLMERVKAEYGVAGEVSLDMISAKDEVFNISRAEEDMDKVWALALPIADAALDEFCCMREAEGEKLCADLRLHAAAAEALCEKIKARSPESVSEAKEKMLKRIRELTEGLEPDEGRLLTECAIYADKADISEELARLDSHFAQFENMLRGGGPVGRKLDFLVQEMNREVNTVGSKSADTEIAGAVIAAKSEIEKIREQIQNIE